MFHAEKVVGRTLHRQEYLAGKDTLWVEYIAGRIRCGQNTLEEYVVDRICLRKYGMQSNIKTRRNKGMKHQQENSFFPTFQDFVLSIYFLLVSIWCVDPNK